MRLKSFTAPSMAEAMRQVRAELGEDTIIVSTRRGPGGSGVRVMAAVEFPGEDSGSVAPARAGEQAAPPALEAIRRTLENHGTPPLLVDQLIHAAGAFSGEDATMALAAAIDSRFRFAPIPENGMTGPFMLVGPPGAGKTVSAARLAARAVLARRPVTVISTDAVRAGGVEQLAAFTRILEVELHTAEGSRGLSEILGRRDPAALTVIDSTGTNPYDPGEMAELVSLLEAAGGEPILVLAAGGDATEMGEVADLFAAAGATRLLVTRLDVARRLGGLLTAAAAGRLSFCDVSLSPEIARGLNPLNPVSLARLLLTESGDRANLFAMSEAVP